MGINVMIFSCIFLLPSLICQIYTNDLAITELFKQNAGMIGLLAAVNGMEAIAGGIIKGVGQ